MRNKIVFSLAGLLMCSYMMCYGFEVEKLAEIKGIHYYSGVAGGPSSPSSLMIDEVDSCIAIDSQYYNFDSWKEKGGDELLGGFIQTNIVLGSYCIGSNSTQIKILEKGKSETNIPRGKSYNGISFILKKGTGYIVYFVDKDGIPGAADTEGKIYNKHEAMAYLKEYDPTKYEESRLRAIKLRVVNGFDDDEVLVWGQTYYSTPRILKEFWKPETYLYPNFGYQIQYDTQGNGYMADYDATGANSDITIVSPHGKHMAVISIHNSSKILETHNKDNDFTASTYVGFGGNVYYFVAGDEYTEVFRIRRTWGDPDMYALAINGYTEDKYGTYVKDVLSRMSKDDLRLLRNHIFALYGFDFKSDDLKTYFDKQVWYTLEPGKTTADIQLPAHRQALFDLIQTEEGKRK